MSSLRYVGFAVYYLPKKLREDFFECLETSEEKLEHEWRLFEIAYPEEAKEALNCAQNFVNVCKTKLSGNMVIRDFSLSNQHREAAIQKIKNIAGDIEW